MILISLAFGTAPALADYDKLRIKLLAEDILKQEVCMRIHNFYVMRSMAFGGNSSLGEHFVDRNLEENPAEERAFLWKTIYKNRRVFASNSPQGYAICGYHQVLALIDGQNEADVKNNNRTVNIIKLYSSNLSLAANNMYAYFIHGLNDNFRRNPDVELDSEFGKFVELRNSMADELFKYLSNTTSFGHDRDIFLGSSRITSETPDISFLRQSNPSSARDLMSFYTWLSKRNMR